MQRFYIIYLRLVRLPAIRRGAKPLKIQRGLGRYLILIAREYGTNFFAQLYLLPYISRGFTAIGRSNIFITRHSFNHPYYQLKISLETLVSFLIYVVVVCCSETSQMEHLAGFEMPGIEIS